MKTGRKASHSHQVARCCISPSTARACSSQIQESCSGRIVMSSFSLGCFATRKLWTRKILPPWPKCKQMQSNVRVPCTAERQRMTSWLLRTNWWKMRKRQPQLWDTAFSPEPESWMACRTHTLGWTILAWLIFACFSIMCFSSASRCEHVFANKAVVLRHFGRRAWGRIRRVCLHQRPSATTWTSTRSCGLTMTPRWLSTTFAYICAFCAVCRWLWLMRRRLPTRTAPCTSLTATKRSGAAELARCSFKRTPETLIPSKQHFQI